MLIRGLPHDARTTELIYEEPQWGESEHLLANIIDLLSGANWQRQNAGLPLWKQSRRPSPHPRPGDRTRALRRASDLASRLKEQARRLAHRMRKPKGSNTLDDS